MRGATPLNEEIEVNLIISIHAPREGSDGAEPVRHLPGAISIHAPREGSDHQAAVQEQAQPQFQSTLPVRGATAGMDI